MNSTFYSGRIAWYIYVGARHRIRFERVHFWNADVENVVKHIYCVQNDLATIIIQLHFINITIIGVVMNIY